MSSLINKVLFTRAGYGLTILRIAVGVIFAAHGSQKLFGLFGGYGLAGTAQYMDSIGLHPGYLMATLAGVAAAATYEERLVVLQRAGIGLWDVIDACDREGSLDSAITNARANPFARLGQLAPRLHDVAFNGGTAGRLAPTFAAAGYRTSLLPSSSPAHAGRTYEQKLALWRGWWRGTGTA